MVVNLEVYRPKKNASLNHITLRPADFHDAIGMCLNWGCEYFMGALVNKNLPLFLCLLIRNYVSCRLI
jgi:hypothetical protein